MDLRKRLKLYNKKFIFTTRKLKILDLKKKPLMINSQEKLKTLENNWLMMFCKLRRIWRINTSIKRTKITICKTKLRPLKLRRQTSSNIFLIFKEELASLRCKLVPKLMRINFSNEKAQPTNFNFYFDEAIK